MALLLSLVQVDSQDVREPRQAAPLEVKVVTQSPASPQASPTSLSTTPLKSQSDLYCTYFPAVPSSQSSGLHTTAAVELLANPASVIVVRCRHRKAPHSLPAFPLEVPFIGTFNITDEPRFDHLSGWKWVWMDTS